MNELKPAEGIKAIANNDSPQQALRRSRRNSTNESNIGEKDKVIHDKITPELLLKSPPPFERGSSAPSPIRKSRQSVSSSPHEMSTDNLIDELRKIYAKSTGNQMSKTLILRARRLSGNLKGSWNKINTPDFLQIEKELQASPLRSFEIIEAAYKKGIRHLDVTVGQETKSVTLQRILEAAIGDPQTLSLMRVEPKLRQNVSKIICCIMLDEYIKIAQNLGNFLQKAVPEFEELLKVLGEDFRTGVDEGLNDISIKEKFVDMKNHGAFKKSADLARANYDLIIYNINADEPSVTLQGKSSEPKTFDLHNVDKILENATEIQMILGSMLRVPLKYTQEAISNIIIEISSRQVSSGKQSPSKIKVIKGTLKHAWPSGDQSQKNPVDFDLVLQMVKETVEAVKKDSVFYKRTELINLCLNDNTTARISKYFNQSNRVIKPEVATLFNEIKPEEVKEMNEYLDEKAKDLVEKCDPREALKREAIDTKRHKIRKLLKKLSVPKSTAPSK